MTPFRDRPALRRATALFLLAGAVLLVVPPATTPLRAWLADRAAVREERALLDRLVRIDAERSAALAAAAASEPPFLVAADRDEALALLSVRVTEALPLGAVELASVEPLGADPTSERPGAPVELRLAFSATASGLSTFLQALEGGRPAVRVVALDVARVPEPDIPVVLSGSARIAAAFLVREAGAP